MTHTDPAHDPTDARASLSPEVRRSRDTAGVEPELTLRRFPPSFQDSEVEADFRRDFFNRSRSILRAALFLGAGIYGAFGILDLLVVAPDHLAPLLAIRYLGVCPMLVLLAVSVNTEAFRRFAQPLLGSAMAAAGVGIIAMTLLTEPPVSGWYYAGLSLVIVYSTSAIRLHFVVAVTVTVVLALAYLAATLLLNDLPPAMVWANTAFLIATVGVGLLSNYTVELFARQRYAHEDRLQIAMREANFQRRQANAANQAKSQFLATMSHELRTPLNAVIGFAEVISLQMLGRIENQKYSDYASHILNSARHLLGILDDILELAKADAGALRLNEDVVPMGETVDAVMQSVTQQAGERGVRLRADPVDPEVDLRADPRLIRQLLTNLLTNAVKFSSEGGRVRLTAGRTQDGGYEIAVQDKGIGIAGDDLERIFEPFTQVESAFARDHGGAGLGLPLVKKIVDLHQGRIDLDSKLGAGTTVRVRLPKSRVLNRGANPGPARRRAS
ncbi:MAG: HAMP domain-containing sensor histidine kinase [Rhodovibrio sp.]|nr:HAMP domain-containing sensor histidine kinase [Rhodovibrio sp.]